MDVNISALEDYIEYFDDYDGYAKVTFRIPQESISNNATSVKDNGKTLVWDLRQFSEDNHVINLEFSTKIPLGFGPILLIIIILIAAAIVGFEVYSRRQKN